MTITQAYQELRQLALIEMRSGLGTFVADFTVEVERAPVPNRPLQLRRLLWRTIAEAKQAGFTQDEIRQTFLVQPDLRWLTCRGRAATIRPQPNLVRPVPGT